MSTKRVDKYDILVDSAVKVFFQKGYHRTKIKDITDNAGLAAGTFYLYFKNKEELLSDIAKKHAMSLYEELDKIYKLDITEVEKLKRIISFNIKYCYDNKEFVSVYLEHIPNSETFNPIKNFRLFRKRFAEIIENVVESGQHKNIFEQSINPIIAASSLHGMLKFTATNIFNLEAHEGITPDHVSETLSQIFIKGLLVNSSDYHK